MNKIITLKHLSEIVDLARFLPILVEEHKAYPNVDLDIKNAIVIDIDLDALESKLHETLHRITGSGLVILNVVKKVPVFIGHTPLPMTYNMRSLTDLVLENNRRPLPFNILICINQMPQVLTLVCDMVWDELIHTETGMTDFVVSRVSPRYDTKTMGTELAGTVLDSVGRLFVGCDVDGDLSRIGYVQSNIGCYPKGTHPAILVGVIPSQDLVFNAEQTKKFVALNKIKDMWHGSTCSEATYGELLIDAFMRYPAMYRKMYGDMPYTVDINKGVNEFLDSITNPYVEEFKLSDMGPGTYTWPGIDAWAPQMIWCVSKTMSADQKICIDGIDYCGDTLHMLLNYSPEWCNAQLSKWRTRLDARSETKIYLPLWEHINY